MGKDSFTYEEAFNLKPASPVPPAAGASPPSGPMTYEQAFNLPTAPQTAGGLVGLAGDAAGAQGDWALTRGWKKAKQNIGITAGLAAGDVEGAARKVAEADAYARANPGTKEGAELMAAWQQGEGIGGGIKGVLGEVAKDWREAPTVGAGLVSVARNAYAMGSGVVEQAPNIVAPMGGMLAGGWAGGKAGAAAGGLVGSVLPGAGTAAGAAVGGAGGALAGAWGGAAAGNTAIEGGGKVMEALQSAGIDPQDTRAVQAFLRGRGDALLGEAAVKGGVIGAVDVATMGVGGALLKAPAKAAAGRALADMGVDMADKAAVKAALKSPELAARMGADEAFKAATSGGRNLARNAGVAALEPAGEFAGEFLGEGIASGEWDAKNATLEALSSLGQSGMTFAGQKAWQAATQPVGRSRAMEQARLAEEAAAAEQQARLNAAIHPQAAPLQEFLDRSLIRPEASDEVDLNQAQALDRLASYRSAEPQAEASAPMRPSEAMGIDPAAGPLSAVAAQAVDSGAHTALRGAQDFAQNQPLALASQAQAAIQNEVISQPATPLAQGGRLALVAGEDGLMRNARGEPFTKAQANLATAQHGGQYAAIEVDGGYALAPKPGTQQAGSAVQSAGRAEPVAERLRQDLSYNLRKGYVEEVREKRGELTTKTLWKTPTRVLMPSQSDSATPPTYAQSGSVGMVPPQGDFSVAKADATVQTANNAQDASADTATDQQTKAAPGQAVAPAAGDAATAPAVPAAGADGGVQAAGVAPERPANWRSNNLRAAKVARDMGIDPRAHRGLANLVAEIDAADRANGARADPATTQPASTATVSRPQGWRASMLGASKVARALGIDPKAYPRTADLVRAIDAHDVQASGAAPALAPVANPKKDVPLSIGTAPGDAEQVGVKDGAVFIGKHEALNFDTGEPVPAHDGAASAS